MCDCVARVNKELAKHFAELDLFLIGPQVPLIAATVRPNRVMRDGAIKAMKRKPTHIIPNYCPFCGERIPEDVAKDNGLSNPA